ncbi:hypothetical protein ACTXT7_012756 [Hymenolepis weldensis]
MPGMNKDEVVVQRCSKCQQESKLQPHQEPNPWPTTASPWFRIHLDFAGPSQNITPFFLPSYQPQSNG